MSRSLLTVVRSLSFGQDRLSDLDSIPESEWPKLLALTDRSQLTLPLALRGQRYCPEWVQERLAGNLRSNAIRHQRVLETYGQLARVLGSAGVDFIVLKGLAQWPHYCDDLQSRPQYDLDIFCPAPALPGAFEAVQSLGYEPFGQGGKIPTDHLPPLIRKTGWRPRGDYYDTEMPLTIELHFRFWDETTERFGVQGGECFWERRVNRVIQGVDVPALDPVDGLSYTTWHLMRHLVRGDIRAYHAYELAHFLERTADDDRFWNLWRDRKTSTSVEGIAFRLALEWFACRAHPIAQAAVRSLPAPVNQWFEVFAWSPLKALQRPNKDELFLHWCLVNGWPDRLRVAKARLFPFRFQPAMLDAHVPAPDPWLRLKRRLFAVWFMARRAYHHARTFAPVMWSGVRWSRALSK